MHRRPFGSSEQRALQAEALLEVSRTLLSTESLDNVLSHIVFHIAEVLKPDCACLLLTNEISNRLEVKSSWGLSPTMLAALVSDSVKEWLRECGTTGRLIRMDESMQDPHWKELERRFGRPLRCLTAAPLVASGRHVGLLLLIKLTGKGWREEEIKYLETFSHLAALAIEHSFLLGQASMVQEVHHRVKNNLQEVANLLSLEMRRVGDHAARRSLENTLNRLKGMSVAYDRLTQTISEGTSAPSLKSMVEALAAEVWAPMVSEEKKVSIRVLGDDVRLAPRKASALGMVINELATNALHHGLAGVSTGNLDIIIRHDENNHRVTICVENDGARLPPGFDARQSARVGLTIVMTLVERELGGQLTFRDGDRTRAEVSLSV